LHFGASLYALPSRLLLKLPLIPGIRSLRHGLIALRVLRCAIFYHRRRKRRRKHGA
jgi:hypothetical protein